MGHLERVQQLLAAGDVEGATFAHNVGVAAAKKRARNGLDLRRVLPELRQSKAELDAARSGSRKK